ncbi:hypothetical protein H257_13241 [Aphanomyces astaci]|uniref:PiggyBac transposable element-derived protein domain-containing protein n=1 Tax=Aphanomyces astaci TaxID=112090 RepID=W4FVS6_APHAT|nr:hypothetical protein H257_13241 [Aphanomyces astaci]ETV71572.1 hypothetical protein H257_13241 [Aphanomyces astaci]|eukprot:XP_009839005.1 hypothetical protein H257_13241 [Aphanomyces astaci]
MRYVVGSENDPDIDTPGKNTKAEAKAMVALYKITWNHTRFQRDEPWITARLFYKVCDFEGEPTYERGTKFLQISLFKPEDESHNLTEWDKKFIANSSFDEETKSDEEINDGSLARQDDDDSGDEWSKFVDRGWKKHGHYDATEDIEGLEHNPVKDFLAFVPLELWKTVTLRTNAKAVALQAAHPKGYVGRKKSIELVGVMKFVGLLIMMSVVQGGEYSLYWSKPSMSFLMPPTENFGHVMPIDRFKQLRAFITFNDVVEPADPLWRIRPLINLLKASFKNFVVAGREISVDEACIPCRSSYGLPLPHLYGGVCNYVSAKVLKKAAADKAAAKDKAAALKRDTSLRQPPTPSLTSRATDKQAEVSYDQRMRRYCVVCYFERNK